MSISRESDMSAPVMAWLEEQGYTVYTEVPWRGRCIDVVGLRSRAPQIIGVEMKMFMGWKVLEQAAIVQIAADEVYCAVASHPRKASISEAESRGLGVLRVISELEDGLDVEMLVIPVRMREVWEPEKRNLTETLSLMGPGGTGGMPFIKGQGPAQLVARAVKAYLLDHPRATWKRVYSEVPNHYATHRSMSGVMQDRFGIRLSSCRDVNQGAEETVTDG